MKKKVIKQNNIFNQKMFGMDIKKARATRKLTLREVSSKTRIPAPTMSWIENSSHSPNVELFGKLVRFYNLNPTNYFKKGRKCQEKTQRA